MMLLGDHGSAWRRRQRRLRSWWRHRNGPVRSRPPQLRQGGGWRRARREVEERELHDAPRRQKPPPPGTRPAPLVEVRPQTGCERHCGSGFELVLEVTVPQLGRELVEVPNVVSQVIEQNVGSSWCWAVSHSCWRSSRFTPRTLFYCARDACA